MSTMQLPVTIRDLERAAFIAAKVVGVPGIKTLLDSYGVARLRALAPWQRPTFIADLEALGR